MSLASDIASRIMAASDPDAEAVSFDDLPRYRSERLERDAQIAQYDRPGVTAAQLYAEQLPAERASLKAEHDRAASLADARAIALAAIGR